MLGFELLRHNRKGIAEVVECHTVEDDSERIGFVPQCRRGRFEHATAQFALPELGDFELLATRALTNQARTATMGASRRRFCGVRNEMCRCE